MEAVCKCITRCVLILTAGFTTCYAIKQDYHVSAGNTPAGNFDLKRNSDKEN